MTADEAREKELVAHKKELKDLLGMIDLYSRTGHSSYSHFGWISDFAKDELEKLGYKVKKWRDGSWEEMGGFRMPEPLGDFSPMTTIRWDKENEKDYVIAPSGNTDDSGTLRHFRD